MIFSFTGLLVVSHLVIPIGLCLSPKVFKLGLTTLSQRMLRSIFGTDITSVVHALALSNFLTDIGVKPICGFYR